ncbi:MAG: hypothetical protein KAR06_01245 [Deltaproteobacteria bacterium]|nr:hypothetical protein [Deltaproteobacteria bacterium]
MNEHSNDKPKTVAGALILGDGVMYAVPQRLKPLLISIMEANDVRPEAQGGDLMRLAVKGEDQQ